MENHELTIKLTIAQCNVVLAALGEMQIKSGVDTFVAIRAQADAQVQELVSQSDEVQPS